MLPHSEAFAKAARDPLAVVVARVDVLRNGAVILDDIPAEADITADRSQWVRRTVSLTLPSVYVDSTGTTHDLTPAGVVSDVLAPFGNELRVYIGFLLPSGDAEMLCQGTFPIWSSDVNEVGDLDVTGYDRCKLVSEGRFPFPKIVQAGTSAMNALVDLLGPIPGEIRFASGVTDVDLDQQTFDQDRDEAVKAIAAALGCEVFCDVWGDFVVQPIPDPYGTPIVSLSGADVLITGKRSIARDGVKNGIVARGTSTGNEPAPISRLVYDNDKSSPTYWFGPFGQVVGYLDSSMFKSDDQATAAAVAQLRNNVGAVKSVDFTLAPDYSLEPGDLARVDIAAGDDQHLLDQLRFSTKPEDAMSAQTRAVGPQGLS